MEVRYLNSFIDSMIEVFASMLQCEIVHQDTSVHRQFEPRYGVTGIIGMTGEAAVTVAMSMEPAVALSATERLTGARFEAVDDLVLDAVGELTNIVAGGAKSRINAHNLELTLPTVIVGRDIRLQIGTDAHPSCIGFECSWGKLCLEVGVE